MALLSFSVVVIALVICSIKNKWFDHSENIDFKSALAAFSVNLIILFVFIMRWSEIINPVVVSLAGLALSVIATPLLPVIVHSYTNTNERINLSTKKISLSDHIVFMLFSVVIITFASSASPLVAINWECDSNCIFTAARGIIHGKLLYSDLVELKGVFMYLIFAVGAFITPYSFTGMWIVEIVFCYLFLIVSTKIQLLFVDKKQSVNPVISGAVVALLYGSSSFDCGNTAEEYGIVFLAAILYLGLIILKEDCISFRKVFIIGLLSGVIFWIKYSMCGAVFGIALFFSVYLIKRKRIKQFFLAVSGVLSGFVTVSLPVVLYYLFRGALNDLIYYYFGLNIFKYHVSSERGSLFDALINPFLALPEYLSDNSQLLIMIVIGFVFLFCYNKKIFSFFATAFVFSFYVALLGNGSVVYYPFVLTSFAIIGALPVNSFITKLVSDRKIMYRIVGLFVSVVLACFYSFPYIKNKAYYGIPKEKYPSYVFARIINNSEDNSFICFGLLDYGFYTCAETDPSIRYYAVLVHDQDIVEQQKTYISENNYNFIITSNNCNYNVLDDESNVFDGYELIAVEKDPYYSGDEFYLFKQAEI